MAVVQAQPVFSSPYEPGREAMRAVEFGQGLRARQDALQRQAAEYNREQQVRELLGSGKPEEAKKLMTLQERSQLVNMQGAMLNQKIAEVDLDMKEKAINDAYGFIDRASKLDPNTDVGVFESEAQSLLSEAAPVAGLNPQIASALGSTIEAKANERKTLLKKVSDEYLKNFNAVVAEDIPFADKINKVNKWVADNPEALQGPFGKRIEDAKNDFIREARSQSLIEASGRTSERDTEFERAIQQGLSEGWLTPEEAVEKRRKRLEYFTTPRANETSDMATIIMALSGKGPATTANPPPTTPSPATSTAPPATRSNELPRVSSKAQFDALPPDSRFIGPDGKVYYKPEAKQSGKNLSDLVTGG